MTKSSITSPDLPAPAGAYSHVVEVNGMVFTAGFGPQDPATGEVPEGVAAQTEQVISNVATALATVGLTLADVVKTTVHLEHLHRDVAEYNAVYESRFPEPYPVRTTVGSTLANILVEIDVVAVRS
jgi:reactive intermediate/imine deaminase